MHDDYKMSENDYRLLKNKYTDVELEKILKKIDDEDYPIQYAIGNVQFIDRIIDVDERVLIPRFSTELLASKVVDYIKECHLENGPFIDICTGSGCIAIYLASKFPIKIEACDKSRSALECASKNAISNNVNIDFYSLDILETENLKNRYSVIVSNPPYVKLDEIVSPNTKYEPIEALYPGEDDIIFYKKMIDLGSKFLLNRGLIAFEIGSTQADRICKYALKVFPDSTIKVEKDYENYDRYLFIFVNCE